jgi:hypothetical protein
VAIKKLGNGNSVKFWKDVWVGDQTLQNRFPRLFGISVQQEYMVRDMGSWVNGVWRWGMGWRREFFVWEEDLHRDLAVAIRNIVITNEEDS